MFFDVYKQLCEKSGKTPTAAALEMGIGRATVSAWKNEGRVPSGKTLQKVADYFGVSVDYLLEAELTTEHDILEDLDVAFLGDFKELTEENKATLCDMARLMLKNQGGEKE